MDFTKVFLDEVSIDTAFNSAVEIVRKNSSGNLWIIGGFVYRTIVQRLYGVERGNVDLDFLISSPTPELQLPDGWKIEINHFGNPRFVRGKTMIDYIPLSTVYYPLSFGCEPTVENVFAFAPLNIQAIAYDFDRDRIIGERGIDAIERKMVEMNHPVCLAECAKRKGMSVQDFIEQKARSVGFGYVPAHI